MNQVVSPVMLTFCAAMLGINLALFGIIRFKEKDNEYKFIIITEAKIISIFNYLLGMIFIFAVAQVVLLLKFCFSIFDIPFCCDFLILGLLFFGATLFVILLAVARVQASANYDRM
jgi:hypothetical protein